MVKDSEELLHRYAETKSIISMSDEKFNVLARK
jgi:hypothetical protein